METTVSTLFELHLLESGISGNDQDVEPEMIISFELHLLESGISGILMVIALYIPSLGLNSTYWNLVFQGAGRFVCGSS